MTDEDVSSGVAIDDEENVGEEKNDIQGLAVHNDRRTFKSEIQLTSV